MYQAGSPNKVVLNVTGAPAVQANLVWTGDGGANQWDINTTSNWLNGGSGSRFQEGDIATFDDTGATNPTVDIPATVSPSGTTVNSASNYTFTGSGGIGGSGGLAKAGTGVLTLVTPNSFTGAVTVGSGGVLVASNHAALGTTAGGVTVATNATLALAGGITVGAEALSLVGDGIVVTNIGVSTNMVGALQNSSGNNTWAGDIAVDTGATQARIHSESGKLTLTGNITNFGTGNFVLQGAGAGEISGVISGARTLFKSAASAVIPGTWTLSGTNTYTGSTTIRGGTLKIATEENLGTTPGTYVANQLDLRAVLQTTADMSLSPNRGINLAGSGGTFNPDSGTTLTVNSIVAGGTNLIKTGAGTLILNGANTYIGDTTNSAGTLLLNATNYTPLVTVQSGATLGGNGFLRSVAVEAGGILAPGANVGKLSLTNLTLAATATNVFEFEVAGNTNDTVDVGGALTPGGSVVQVTIATGTLAVGSYPLFSYVGPKTGNFDPSVVLAGGSAAGSLRLQETVANQISLVVGNTAPVANADSLAWGKGVSNKSILFTSLTANDTDADGDTLTLIGVDATSANGVPLTTNATSIQYTGALTNDDSFSYTISDGFGGTASALVSITATNSVGQSGEIAATPTNATATFYGIPGTNYYVMRATNVTFDAGISNFPSAAAPGNGVIQVVDDFADIAPPIPATAFYRLIAP